ncbi:hypothetical protein HJG53_10365 [Sphingomonas sp. ID1715]|uniref:hypothetical protein n=1 Tax=Sphingomonas sp. ID1715 TaxID=1656898 RepID=UPI0014896404|nr:hypothetical protein [Sphingomonas sp. ID1715]NNM77308.1 hypothetical protein [Sphingomonas sp. ID1715]
MFEFAGFALLIACFFLPTVGSGYVGGRISNRQAGSMIYIASAFAPLFVVGWLLLNREPSPTGLEIGLWQGIAYLVVFGLPGSMTLATIGFIAGSVIRRRNSGVI